MYTVYPWERTFWEQGGVRTFPIRSKLFVKISLSESIRSESNWSKSIVRGQEPIPCPSVFHDSGHVFSLHRFVMSSVVSFTSKCRGLRIYQDAQETEAWLKRRVSLQERGTIRQIRFTSSLQRRIDSTRIQTVKKTRRHRHLWSIVRLFLSAWAWDANRFWTFLTSRWRVLMTHDPYVVRFKVSFVKNKKSSSCRTDISLTSSIRYKSTWTIFRFRLSHLS